MRLLAWLAHPYGSAVTRLIIPFVLGVLGPIAVVGYLLLQN